MKYIQNAFSIARSVYIKSRDDAVYGAAGHSTLFLVISFFPLVMLFISLIRFSPLTEEQVIEVFDFISPMNIKNIISEVFESSGSVAISISAATLIWSASASIFSITKGLNLVYNKKETRNYFLVRAASIIYTVAFIISLTAALGLLVFGGTIIEFISYYLPLIKSFEFIGKLIAFAMITIIFNLLYTIVPNRPSKPLFELPGAVFSAIGWYLFSFFYSIYINNFSNIPSIYGSIGAIVLLLIWLYVCMYIFFLGAELNAVLEERGMFRDKRNEFFDKRKAKKRKWKI